MNLYENQQADARQGMSATLLAGEVLFRPRYRQLTAEEVDLHDRIKAQATVLAALFYEVAPIHLGPTGNRERGANVQLAIRSLEDAVYRAVKALTGPVEQYVAGATAAAETERKPGINDLPADQQRQLDNGEPVAPRPDPGSQPVRQDDPDDVGHDGMPPRAGSDEQAATEIAGGGRPADGGGERAAEIRQPPPGGELQSG